MSHTCGACGHTSAVALATCGRCGASSSATSLASEAAESSAVPVPEPAVDDRTVSRSHLSAFATPDAPVTNAWNAAPPPPPQTGAAVPAPGPPRTDIGARVLAYLVDSVVLAVVIFVPIYVVLNTPLQFLGVLWCFACLFGFIWTTGVSGQTVGKRLMGQQVVDVRTGEVIGVGRAFQRYLIEGLSNMLCYAGMWSAFLDGRSGRYQAWHDKACSTWVVSVPRRGIDSTLWSRRRS